jgi:hypothetical protein
MYEIPLPVLILQHPQEPSRSDRQISSARLIQEHVHPSFIKTGLSWKSLTHALSGWKEIEEIEELKQPGLWHTLYLGTRKKSYADPTRPGIYYLNKKGEVTEPRESPVMGGLILLDGTWSQAKTLWWRNAWLTKTQRIFIVPEEKSLYGNLRKEPRPECVSTLEALAETLNFLGFDQTMGAGLKEHFSAELKKFRMGKN